MPRTSRPWFQLHLSTALLLMFCAGGLYYFNLTPRLIESNYGNTYYHGKTYDNIFEIYAFGWPAKHCRKFVYGVPEVPEGYYPETRGIVIDIAVALGILLLIAILAEFVQRRRARPSV